MKAIIFIILFIIIAGCDNSVNEFSELRDNLRDNNIVLHYNITTEIEYVDEYETFRDFSDNYDESYTLYNGNIAIFEWIPNNHIMRLEESYYYFNCIMEDRCILREHNPHPITTILDILLSDRAIRATEIGSINGHDNCYTFVLNLADDYVYGKYAYSEVNAEVCFTEDKPTYFAIEGVREATIFFDKIEYHYTAVLTDTEPYDGKWHRTFLFDYYYEEALQ